MSRPPDSFDMESIERLLEFDQNRRADERTAQVLKRKGGALEAVKASLREGRKDTMRTVKHFLCDHCDTPIMDHSDGFVIHGNIYQANPDELLGIIGNNFPETETFSVDAVKKTVFCRRCLVEALSLHTKGIRR